MPTFPRYNSTKQPTTQQPSVLAPTDNTGAVIAETGQKIGSQVQDITMKWSNTVDTIQKTTAQANFKTGMLDIQNRAANDPDYNNSDSYFKEIEKLRKDSLKGFSSKLAETGAAIEFGYEAKVGQIQIDNLYKKKMIDVGQANSIKLLELISKTPGTTPETITENVNNFVNAGLFSHKDGYEIEQKYVKSSKFNSFLSDLGTDPDLAEKNLSKNTYGLDTEQIKDARGILKTNKEESKKQTAIFQNDNEQKIGSLLISGTPAEQVISELDATLERGEISEENYNLVKNSLRDKYAGESDEKQLVSLLLEYSKIGDSEDPIKSVRKFRNEVLIRKADLSEAHFKQFLEWSGSDELNARTPGMSGLQTFIKAVKAGFQGAIPPLALKNVIETAMKFMQGEYQVGQTISKGGREFEVIKQDDGSIGFKVLD